MERMCTYLLYVTVVLISLNPVLIEASTSITSESPTTVTTQQPSTTTTTQTTSSSLPPSTTSQPSTTSTQAATTTPEPATTKAQTTPATTITQSTTTPEPTTTTQPATTTQPTTTTTTRPPSEIGTSCTNNTTCGANAECGNTTCECLDGFYQTDQTNCQSVSQLIVNIATSHSTETTLYIAWNGPSLSSNITYILTYKVEIIGADSVKNSTETTDQNVTFMNLTPGTEYNVSIQSVLNHTIESEAAIKTEWTQPQAPSCPAYRNNYTTPIITVSWPPPSGGVDGYRVTVVSLNFDQTTTSESIVIPNTLPGVNVTLKIQTYLDLSNGTRLTSTEQTCDIRTESAAPNPPQNVNSINTNGTSIVLKIDDTATPNGDIIAYQFKLYKKYYVDEEFMFDQVQNINKSADNQYELSSLVEGTYYYIQVFTVNDGFTGKQSFNITDIKTLEGVPGQVTNQKYNSSKTSIDVTWMRPDVPRGDIIGYQLLISVDGECWEYLLNNSTFNIPSNGTCNSTTTSIEVNLKNLKQTIEGLLPFRQYQLTIWAFTAQGRGQKLEFTVNTLEASPYMPTIGRPIAIDSVSINVTWQIPSLKTGQTTYSVSTYDVVAGRDAGLNCIANGFDKTSCRVFNLKEFWKYKFNVTARTSKGTNTSEFSDIIFTKASKPGFVTGLRYNLVFKKCQLTLIWGPPKLEDRNSNITSYEIYADSSYLTYRDPNPDPFGNTTREFRQVITVTQKDSGKVDIVVRAIGEGAPHGELTRTYVTTSQCYEPLSAGEIIGIAVCVVLTLAIIVFAGWYGYRKKEQILQFFSFKRQSDDVFEPLQPYGERQRPNFPVRPKNRLKKRPIVINDIDSLLRRFHADDNRLFQAEYEDLKGLSPRYDTNAANLDENKPKNRYTNILPFDHSRVILSPTDDEESSDYINANYIPGYMYGKEYIASQGPLPGTSNDFWRMIWEQGVSVVVMLTKCKENNTDKCDHYWPYAVNEPKCYDDLMVNITSISNMDKFDITVMDLNFGDESRVIKHFHFLEWPDFSAKVETTILIDFITTVRSHITPDVKGPIIIHCSAGVGRTGTYITVDYLMQFVRDNELSSQVDIFDWVLQMRESRATMVQTWTQYAFIHDCLKDIADKKKRMLESSTNGDVSIDNLGFEPDELYENTKIGKPSKLEDVRLSMSENGDLDKTPNSLGSNEAQTEL